MDIPQNVVPFRPVNEHKHEPRFEPKIETIAPTLTPVENSAFNELARQLSSRLEQERLTLDSRDKLEAAAPEPIASHETPKQAEAAVAVAPSTVDQPAAWLSELPTPPRVDARRDALLYDRMPVGILVYRLDQLLYANRPFLDRVGYRNLQDLAAEGGLDALYVEPCVPGGDSTTDEGTPVRIAANNRDDNPTEARLHGISWDGDAAHALIFAAPQVAAAAPALAAAAATLAPASPSIAPDTGECAAILDASDDGILVFDADGRILACNRGARTLFGYDEADLVQRHLTDLFSPQSQPDIREAIAGTDAAAEYQTREVGGRTRSGDALALAIIVGRTAPGRPRWFAICRSRPPMPSQAEQAPNRRQTDGATHGRADILARISHEIRTPLSAIIGFADVMIDERFGPLGNERYSAYMKDIRAAGERVLAIVNDLVELSRAETGSLDLTFANHDLNDMVERCVTIMQPQANRERIIIRTSLAHALPPVSADATALRQIVLNLVGNSIHVARAGGQVIVSTALTDLGDVVLRVRDSGRGPNHTDMDAATEPFRNPASEQLAQDNAGINLSLTRALVEANLAHFHIRSAPQSGTLVEVAFPPRTARAG